jgi:hypothetical protein
MSYGSILFIERTLFYAGEYERRLLRPAAFSYVHHHCIFCEFIVSNR